MDEASGNLADSSGSNTGTAVGGPTYGVTGVINDAISYDGINDAHNLGTMGTMGTNMNLGSISFWMKTSQTTTDSILGTFSTSIPYNQVYVKLNEPSQDKMTFSINAAGDATLTGYTTDATTFTDGEWHHF